MSFVRKLVLSCLKHNMLFRARHVPEIHNNLADSLSRLQIQRFQQLALAHMHPTPQNSEICVNLLLKRNLNQPWYSWKSGKAYAIDD